VANYGPELTAFCEKILDSYGCSKPQVEEFYYKKYDFNTLSPRLLPATLRRKYYKFDNNIKELYDTGLQNYFVERMAR
ncbi:hypothetical protein, partial [Acidithiobacillus sp.]|uniref:hypothetical protein n=1 Tax=Acidithiobacillus sp. TaxID=1872118 RepID=UPI003D025212